MNTADTCNDCDLHLGQARADINDLGRALNVALNRASNDALGVTWALDKRHGLVRDLKDALAVASRLASCPTRDLIRQLEVLRALDHKLLRIHLDANDVDYSHDVYDKVLLSARGALSNLIGEIDQALSSSHARRRADPAAGNATGAVPRQREARRQVAPLAIRLLAAATRILPSDDRPRYAEEFRSELAEIALSGARRHTQLAYAARQVMSSGCLRLELRAPRRRGAAS